MIGDGVMARCITLEMKPSLGSAMDRKRYVPKNPQYSVDVVVLALCLGHLWIACDAS